MVMNAYEFAINYKKLISMIKQIIQPQFLKYINKLRKEEPLALIKSNTTFNSEMEALGFLCLKVLELYYEDMDNKIFDDDEFLLYVDDWFIQAMNLEFGKSKYTSKDSSMVWVSDLSNNKKLNGYTFKIEVNYDKTTKSVKELSVGGFTKKTKKFIGHSSTLFLGEDIDDLINKIYDLSIDIVEEYKS
jgi:hypothetical protein